MPVAFEELSVSESIRDSIRRQTASEYETLKSNIIKDKSFTDPILYVVNSIGIPLIVDGYTRYQIKKELGDSVPVPETKEVEELKGCSFDKIVEWVNKHQAGRRNDESLAAKYFIATQCEQSTVKEVAERNNITEAVVRHSISVSDKIDEMEREQPGLKDLILNSDLTANAINVNSPDRIVELINNSKSYKKPSEKRDSDKFDGVISMLEKFSRGLNKIVNNSGSNSWHEEIVANVNSIGKTLNEWKAAVVLAEEE